MQSTQGILLDFLALMAKGTGDSKLHGTITIRKKVIGKLSQSRNFTDRRQTQSQTSCEKGLIGRKTSVCDLTQYLLKKSPGYLTKCDFFFNSCIQKRKTLMMERTGRERGEGKGRRQKRKFN